MMPPQCLGHSQCPCPKCTGLDILHDLAVSNAQVNASLIAVMKEELEMWRKVGREFCAKVDRGEARSTRTYNAIAEILEKYERQEIDNCVD